MSAGSAMRQHSGRRLDKIGSVVSDPSDWTKNRKTTLFFLIVLFEKLRIPGIEKKEEAMWKDLHE